jgi:protein-disulfide isomerase
VTRRELITLVAVIAIGLAAMFALKWTAPVGRDVSNVPFAAEVRRDRYGPASGSADADMTLIVFTDYQCSACRIAHPRMQRAVEADGRVRIVYRDWPIFGAPSERAARVAVASDYQGIYPALHDRLMRASRFDDAALQREVEAVGGDWQRLLEDLARHGDRIEARVAETKRQAFGLGLGGTPGYLVGGILLRGAHDEGEFARAIQRARDLE